MAEVTAPAAATPHGASSKAVNPNAVTKSTANALHSLICKWYPDQAGKLTGMFLQNHDEEKVAKYLKREDRLKNKIVTFVRLLEQKNELQSVDDCSSTKMVD